METDMVTTSAHAEPQWMTPEIEALVAAQVEEQLAAKVRNYHNKAVVRGKPVVPVTLVVGEVFGVCEALLIQQIHFWCVSHGHLKNGHKWSRNTYAQWAEQLRMFSERSVERALRGLVTLGVVVTGVFNARIYDRTLWYRLDYECLCKLMSSNLGGNWEVLCPDDSSLSIAEIKADLAANTVASEPTLLAPPIPEIPEQPENKKECVLSKQSAELTTKPQTLLVTTGTAGEEKIENNLKVLGGATPAPKGKFVNKPVEAVKTSPATAWMNAGKPLPEKLRKRAERAKKAVEQENMLKEKKPLAKGHCVTTPIALAAYWESCMTAKTSHYQKPLTGKEIGMLKKLGKDLGDKATTVIDFTLNNWVKFASKAAAEAGTGVWPPHPNIWFLLAHRAVAVNLLQSAAEQDNKNQELKVTYETEKHSQPIPDSKLSVKAPIKIKFTPEQCELVTNGGKEADEFWAKVIDKYGEDSIVKGMYSEVAVLCDVA